MTTTTTAATEIFWIPSQNLGWLAEQMGEYAKRAEKLGEAPMRMQVIDERTADDGEREVCVRISGIPPKVPGWQFVAALDHLAAGNVVRITPGAGEVPLDYREIGSHCDHCSTKRVRNSTYIVLHDETGVYKQIGKSCLKEYLGHPDAVLLAELAAELADIYSGMSGTGSKPGSREKRQYACLAEYLPHVAAQMREAGWVSYSKSKETGAMTTANRALLGFRGFEGAAELIAADYITARAAVTWAQALPAGGEEYLHNLQVLAHSGVFHLKKHAGIAAAMVMSYLREVEQEYTDGLPATTTFFGTVNEKISLTALTVEQVFTMSGKYGTTHVHYFRDTDGNMLMWRASTGGLEKGKTYDITATVKSHEKMTVLTRVFAH